MEVKTKRPYPLRRLAVAAVYRTRTIVRPHPFLALPMARLLGEGEVVDPATDIVIEAFPSSANSFAVAAFRLAQEPDAARIAHHTHAPGQVIKAIRLGVPALVLIREPEEAILSLLARSRSLTPVSALRGFVGFYEPLMPHRGGFVVGSFREVVGDFGTVMRRVNTRFGTRFREFQHTEANVSRILEKIEAHERTKGHEAREVERLIPRPSEIRTRLKRDLREGYRSAPQGLKARADDLFAGLTQHPSPT